MIATSPRSSSTAVRRNARTRRPAVKLRMATAADAAQIHALISRHAREGHLLPRTLNELTLHAERFVVATRHGAVVACGDLAPLSLSVGEIRSFVVDESARHAGLGQLIVNELRRRARIDGFDRLCAFTHAPGYFARLGFSIVPHTWLPEKIAIDCSGCALFRRCGQFAMLLDLEPAADPRSERMLSA